MGNRQAKRLQKLVEDLNNEETGAQEELKKTFNKYDKDGNKVLEGNEIDVFFKDLFDALFVVPGIVEGADVKNEEKNFVEMMTKETDENGDGKLELEEIRSFLIKALGKYTKKLISV